MFYSPFLRFLASKLGEGQVLFLLMLLTVEPGTGIVMVSILLSLFYVLCPECHEMSRYVTTLTAFHLLLSQYCLRSKLSEINCGKVSVNPFATDTKFVDIIYTNIHTDTEIRNSVAKQQRRNTLKWLLKYSGRCHVSEKTRVTGAETWTLTAKKCPRLL